MALLGYIQTHLPKKRPQLLDVHTQNQTYTFSLQTAHLGEHRPYTGQRPCEHAHHVFHLILFTEGVNYFQIGNRIVPSEPGTLVLADPGQPHDFGPVNSGETRYHEITFMLEHLTGPLIVSFRQLLEFYVGLPLANISFPRVLTPSQRTTLENYLQSLIENLCHPGGPDWFRDYRLLLDIFSFLIVEVFAPVGETNTQDRGQLVKVKTHIDHYYASVLSIQNLAEIAHCSEAHLCRAFKKEYGLSPIAYQQSLRIEAAKILIRSTNKRCKEIAHRLGYADVYCFSKAFRKQTGLSPTQYRRRLMDL